ncbi:MAG: acyl-CoA thioester hydrolase [Polaribacter sp.]|jgi:acyl-CoA thioester hydrolase
MKKTKSILSTFPVTSSIVVQWADMDAAQHVNNVIYLRWAEVSRVDYFDALKIEVVPTNGDAGFILGWQDCKYIFPVTYPDTIHIGIRITEVKEDRLLMESHFFSEKHDRIVAISKQMVVTYDYVNLKKVVVPDLMRERINKLEELK